MLSEAAAAMQHGRRLRMVRRLRRTASVAAVGLAVVLAVVLSSGGPFGHAQKISPAHPPHTTQMTPEPTRTPEPAKAESGSHAEGPARTPGAQATTRPSSQVMTCSPLIVDAVNDTPSAVIDIVSGDIDYDETTNDLVFTQVMRDITKTITSPDGGPFWQFFFTFDYVKYAAWVSTHQDGLYYYYFTRADQFETGGNASRHPTPGSVDMNSDTVTIRVDLDKFNAAYHVGLRPGSTLHSMYITTYSRGSSVSGNGIDATDTSSASCDYTVR
jgi:hypothetical protein